MIRLLDTVKTDLIVPAASGFVRIKPMPTAEEIDEIIDNAFMPKIREIEAERKLVRDYYLSGLSLGKFCMSRQINMDAFTWILKKYHLSRKPSSILVSNSADPTKVVGNE